jgi:hypothetical protein
MIGVTSRTVFGTTEKRLIQTVAIEQNCPQDSVKIIDKVKVAGHATYALDACGERKIYKQVGSVFMEASQAEKIIKTSK